MRRARVKEKPGASISLLFSKRPRGLPGFTYPSYARIAINNEYFFIINAIFAMLLLL